MSEELLVKHCAPTLAGIKTANLFNCPYPSKNELKDNIRSLNKRLIPKGLRVLPLRCKDDRALIYIYRPQKLKKDLSNSDATKLLKDKGYSCQSPERCITKLISKLKNEPEFPHEIGFFLGYPPEDVIGFIENKSCKCTGCWKVYGNEANAKKTFAQYKKCTDVYYRQWSNGKSIEQLTVAD